MRTEDFLDTAPGILVVTQGDQPAFVPNPLPDTVELKAETVRLLAKAENAVGRLAGTTAREFNPYLIGSPLLHREAILSSRMEGTITTPEQLVLLEAEERSDDGGSDRADPDTREVLNYMNAMRRGLELLTELPPCLRLIRETHAELLSGVRGDQELPGQFRRGQNFIGGRGSHRIEDARFVPPPVHEMNKCLNDFEQYLNREQTEDADPLLVQLALIHYQFETIHPFRDGNGRIGRLLVPLLLKHHGRIEAPILYVSAYFERHREAYVDGLLNVSQTGDWSSWINFFLRGVRESAEEAIAQADGLLELRTSYHRKFQKGRSSALLIRLIDRLFQAPSITIRSAARVLDVSDQAAANNIHKLEEAGVLREVTGKERYKVFIADEVVGFMYDRPQEKTNRER